MKTKERSKNRTGEHTQLKNDPVVMMRSLRESVLRRIEEINSAAELEIKKIDETIGSEIENFRISEEKKYRDKLEYEESRLGNLSSIEIKKQKLEGVESFIESVIVFAASALRADPGYPDFLKKCMLDGLSEVNGRSATVCVSPEDADLSGEIIKDALTSGYGFTIKILTDTRAGSGGALVIDDDAEVIYNNTSERIMYRKNVEIRREILRGLQDSGIYKED